jgi:hypothetical protein
MIILISLSKNGLSQNIIRIEEYLRNSLIQDKEIGNYTSLTPSIASNISQKLDADMFVYGKIIKAGPALLIYAQLIDSRIKEVVGDFLFFVRFLAGFEEF